MKQYIGVKEIEAVEAWRCEWENGNVEIIQGDASMKFQDIFVASADKAEFGYKVKYDNGYESWSPKKVFEEAYQPITALDFQISNDAELPDYQMRVVKEKNELEEKFVKLETFVKSEKFMEIDYDEQIRLSKQASAMYAYLNILRERINNFEVPA